ncbi:hypothetical protein KSP40_PGU018900 [Platanthera guangdongensis]|uniref:ATP-dependent Clp protease proteolytic subunit n=1 Tax=Platanthera guangdongensis TaxID=2320717 RepID=A0ABR2LC76_9ASPA
MAIYDTMQSLKSPVGTNCVGYAYNLAGFLLAAGEKGNRVAMPLCRIALQSPAGATRGQANDVHNEANELLRIRDYLFGELAKKTQQPIEKADSGSGMSTGDGKLQEMEIQCAEVMGRERDKGGEQRAPESFGARRTLKTHKNSNDFPQTTRKGSTPSLLSTHHSSEGKLQNSINSTDG